MTGIAFGGNKVRKLELALAEAQANGARTLVTVGAVQSNHCRQTAAIAAHYGMDCILVLSGDPSQAPSGNLLLDKILGAEIVWTNRNDRTSVLQQTFDQAWESGRRPYLIPLGASNPLGTLGYMFAFEELLTQPINPDWIVVASSSGGTQAGLVLGSRRAGWKGRILGISIEEREDHLQRIISHLATEASDLAGQRMNFAPSDILVNDNYLGEGYGVMGDPEKEAIQVFARQEGLLLDPVYTGRAAAGLIDLIRHDFFKTHDTILFWHTGGTPALFAGNYQADLIG
jgi:1-aminocyclopropane-1-carboxylate deaminase/D-cysteine desulfhydrase-like pyridoxal-dependent ACC family enzyme